MCHQASEDSDWPLETPEDIDMILKQIAEVVGERFWMVILLIHSYIESFTYSSYMHTHTLKCKNRCQALPASKAGASRQRSIWQRSFETI